MRWLAILLFCLAFSADVQGSGAACAAAELDRRGDAVRAARERLAAMPVGDGETHVPPQVQAGIETLKDRLAHYVIGAVSCAGSREAAEAIARRLAAQGHAVSDHRRMPADGDFPDMHGARLGYEVSVPPAHPSLLAVVARFGINCGEDALFFLFDRSGGGVRRLIVRRSEPYDEVSGAWEGFRYVLSPAGRGGRWYVATAHTPPWCTSVWRSLTYDLARPGREATRPDIFFSKTVGHNIDSYLPVALRASPNRFQVEHDGGILDPLINRRRHVETYAIAGDAVRRIQPAAFNVRDFVDEWLSVPWAEARSWAAAAPALAEAHRAIAGPSAAAGSHLVFGPIRR